MGPKILITFSLILLLTSCVPKEEADFVTFKAPELQKANDLNTLEENSIELEIPELKIGDDAASKKMGERYSYRIVKNPKFGKVENCLVGKDRLCTYHPNKDFFGTDEFSYIAFDGPVESNVITIKIDVTNINDPPMFIDGELYKVIKEDEYSLIELERALDVDRDELIYQIVETPTNGYIEKCFETGMSCYYKPDENFTGKDRFSYIASDGEYQTTVKIVNINVDPSNDRPAFEKSVLSYVVPEDNSIKISTPFADDVEDGGDKLNYVIVNFPIHGTLSGCGKKVNEWSCDYTPAPNFYGDDFFRIIAVDSSAEQSEPLRFNITVVSVPDAPYFTKSKQTISLNEDTLTILRLEKAIDVDNDIKSYSIKSSPASGTLYDCLQNNLDTVCSFKPAKDFYGKLNFVYEVVDRTNLKSTMLVELNVNPVNDPPKVIYKNIFKKVTEDVVLKFDLSDIQDVDNASHTYYNFSSPLKGKLSCSGKSCEYTPNLNFSGTDSFTYLVKDSGNLSDSGKISLSVEEVDDPPALADKEIDLFEDSQLVFDLPKAMDIDSTMHTYALAVAPKNGTLTDCFVGNKIKACKYTPKANFYGKDELRFTATDTTNTATGTITFNVLPVNDYPYWKNQNELSFTVAEDTPTSLSLLGALDLEDGSDLIYELISAPKNGEFEENCFKNGKINCIYTPKKNYYGSDIFTYKATDKSGYSTSIKNVSITITPVDDIPATTELTVTLVEDVPKRFNIPKAEDDDTNLTYEETVATKNGVITECFKFNKIKNCLYTPNEDFYGDDEVTYSVKDNTNTVFGKVKFVVTPVNDKPKWDDYNDLVLQTKEDTPLVIGLTAAKDAEDGRDLDYDYIQIPSRGTLDLNCLVGKNLNCTYTPNRDVYGVDTIKYIAKDKTGEKTVVKEVTINITPVNDPPEVDELVKKTERNTPLTFRIQPIIDVESTSFTINYKVAVSNGTLTGCVSAGRVYPNIDCVYTPALDFEGVDGFEFDVIDVEHTVRGKVSINVEDPYLKQERKEINVEEREKPLIKIAVLVDTTQSMKVYQDKLVASLTPMFQKLHSYSVEIHLFYLNPLLSNNNYIQNYTTQGNFIKGRVILDRQKHGMPGDKYAGIQKAMFKVDPKATIEEVNVIASEIATKIGQMGASQKYHENGLHQMGLLLAHPESLFNGDEKFGGFIVLSNENSYANDSSPRGALQLSPLYTFREYRQREGTVQLDASKVRRDGDWFGFHRVTMYHKSKMQKYNASYSNGDGVGSSYNCEDNTSLSYNQNGTDGSARRCRISGGDLPSGYKSNDDLVCVRCVDEGCTNFQGFLNEFSYNVGAVYNDETKELVRKAFTVTCKAEGGSQGVEEYYWQLQQRFADDGYDEDKCQEARDDITAHWMENKFFVTKLLPENDCSKYYYINEATSYPPSITEQLRNNNGPVGTYPLVNDYLTKNSKTVANLASNVVLEDMLLELIDQKIGLENAYMNFIIHSPEVDALAGCSEVVGSLGSTDGNAYKRLHDLLVGNEIASSTINSICSNDYSNALDGLKAFIEDKTDNVFLTGVTEKQRLFSVEVTRSGKKLNFVKNRDFTISKDGVTVTFTKGILEPDDKIVFVIRTYE